jgi:hypothetical protein
MAWMVIHWIHDKNLNFLRKATVWFPRNLINHNKGGVHPLFPFRHIPTDKFDSYINLLDDSHYYKDNRK